MEFLTETDGTDAVPGRPQGEPSILSITLQCGPEGIEVQSVEFNTGEMITRCAFRAHRRPADVLSPKLAVVVEELVAEAGCEIGILSKPEFMLALPGIVLSGARIMVSRTRAALHYVHLRFHQCFGNVAGVFAAQTRPWRMGHDQSAQIAAETLETVFLPLRNLAAYLDALPGATEASGPLEEVLRGARRRIEDLELYYHMLTEFLSAQEPQSPRRSSSVVARLASRD